LWNPRESSVVFEKNPLSPPVSGNISPEEIDAFLSFLEKLKAQKEEEKEKADGQITVLSLSFFPPNIPNNSSKSPKSPKSPSSPTFLLLTSLPQIIKTDLENLTMLREKLKKNQKTHPQLVNYKKIIASSSSLPSSSPRPSSPRPSSQTASPCAENSPPSHFSKKRDRTSQVGGMWGCWGGCEGGEGRGGVLGILGW
jgi:hypothetical protein